MDQINKLNFARLLQMLPKREPSAHKGNFGHVLVIGGDYGYPGAPVLAALGALRAGAGLVTVASHRDNILGLNSYHPEIMATAIDEPSILTSLMTKASVIVLGPGLGRSAWSQQVFTTVINTELPMVLDADGLYFLSQTNIQRRQMVLTPHPGEAAVLLKQTTAEINFERLAAIKLLISQYQATVVLKGSGTLVGSPGTEIEVCNAGNPGMASGGMGDLLSGIIAGLIAQNMDLTTATKLAVCTHAMAGDMAARAGQRGLIATDLLTFIRQLLNK